MNVKKLSDVRVGDVIRPVHANEPWMAIVLEIHFLEDHIAAVVQFEDNDYDLIGGYDWVVEYE
jgi:hypothetical protein